MLDKFKQKFVEEALDNVADLEEALFQLEKEPENEELVERIFRSMHTIKGGGAMFGFNDLSAFTHNLETIFDMVRNKKLAVDKEIISLTFESLDYIRQLLDLGDLTDEEDINRQKEYIAKIQRYFTPDVSAPAASKAAAPAAPAPAAPAPAAQSKKNYLITIEPLPTLLDNGTNPLFILDDLTAMGDWKTMAFIKDIPSYADFKPLTLGIRWQVLLSTEQDVNDIKDVFIFVEDECKVDIAELVPGNYIAESPEPLVALLAKAAADEQYLKAADFEQFKVVKKAAPKPKEEKGKAAADAKISTMRVASSKIDELVNAVSELVTMQAQFSLLAEKNGDPNLIAMAEQMEKLTRQLRENSFEMSLIPLQGELVRFQRLVRDLSKTLNKELEFVVEGGDIELDKNIIEHLMDPMLHIIRNSADHGIELPEERIKKGKNPKGTILLKAFYSGSSVIIKISDDGKGMDPDKLLKKGIERGLVDPGVTLSKSEILNLIFASGFSTAEKVSDVSGRGVGMDVVKSKIAEIRGDVIVDSEKDQGTTLTLELPLTLSIIDGLLTKVKGEQYVVPLSNIERILTFVEVEFSQSGLSKSFLYQGEQIPYIDVAELFYSQKQDDAKRKILLVKFGDRRVGLVVDEIVGEYQIVVKPLGRYMRRIDMISGASVMGDGSLSLVIDTNRLINYYNQRRLKKKESE